MGTRVRWGPTRHDNHEGQRMTPGARRTEPAPGFPGTEVPQRREPPSRIVGNLVGRQRVGRVVPPSSTRPGLRGARTLRYWGDSPPTPTLCLLLLAALPAFFCFLERSFHPTCSAEGPAGACLRAPPLRASEAHCHPRVMHIPVVPGSVTHPPFAPRPRRSKRWAQRRPRPPPCGCGSGGSPPPQGPAATGS